MTSLPTNIMLIQVQDDSDTVDEKKNVVSKRDLSWLAKFLD